MTTLDQTRLPSYDRRHGDGPTLLFLHYWGGSARTWDLVADRLSGRDAIAVDARGWGRSRGLPGPYSLEQMAEDTLGVIDDAGVGDYVLVGHSMGGKVAQLVAARRPVGLRAVVLVASGPAVPPESITTEYRQALSTAYDTDESVAAARDGVLTATVLPMEIKAQVATDSRASAPGARTEWPLRGISTDISERTRLIDVPTLVIAGELDQVEPETVLRHDLLPHLANARFRVLASVGHLIPLEAPTYLAHAISNFPPPD